MHQTLEPGWRRIAFYAWAAILVAVLGVAFFGLTSLVLAWFQEVEGVAGPVTDLGYGVLLGIILTTGLLVQLRSPERKIAGVQQAFLVIPALVIGSAIASDSQNLVPALILLPAIGILLALHPAREEFFRRGVGSEPDTPRDYGSSLSSHSFPTHWTWERRRETWRVLHTTCSACRRWPPWPLPSC